MRNAFRELFSWIGAGLLVLVPIVVMLLLALAVWGMSHWGGG